MADKNNNGIDDSLERFRPGQKVAAPKNAFDQSAMKRAGINPYFDQMENGAGRSPIQQLWGNVFDAARQGLNFFGDLGLGGEDVQPKANRIGTGFGDQLFGVTRDYYDKINSAPRPARQAGKLQRGPAQQQGPADLSFLQALQQAMGMVPGASMISRINYDPQRQAARDQAGEADARIGAMYRQLQDSIAADQPGIQAAYQQAIDNTNAGSQAAQQSVQAATDAAQQRNQGVLAALGIGDANQQIIAQGRDVNSATANTMADMAAAQQADTNALTQNQATAVQQNRSIGSAAGLEGNLQRAQNQAKLQALLAQIDMAEQDKNASIDAQNSQAGSGAFSQAMSLAGQLYGEDQNRIDRQSALQQAAFKAANPAPTKAQNLAQILQMLTADRGGGQGSFIDPSQMNQDQLLKLLSAVG